MNAALANVDNGSLKQFFTPRSIAILGASGREGTMGWRIVSHLQQYGYSGSIYPINPNTDTILGLKTYKSILDVKAPIDLAYCLLAAEKTVEAFEQCEQAGVKFIIIASSGFAELGEKGQKMQQYITDFAKRTNIRVLGPNCQGAINFVDNVAMSFSSAMRCGYNQGSIAIVSQSGATGNALYNMATERGMGLAYLVTTGNEADLSALDFIDYMLDDPRVTTVVAYMEGLHGGPESAKKLFALGQKSLRQEKPIVMLKPGKSEAARQAISSHTAALAASDLPFDALLKQAGIVRVNSIDELLDTAYAFADLKVRPQGNRVAISSTSGGAGVMLTDACSELGMGIPELQPETIAKINEVLPAFSTAQNPLDMTANVINDSDGLIKLCSALADDPNIDILIIGIGVNLGKDSEKRGNLICEVAKQINKPLLVTWVTGENSAAPGHKVLKEAKIPVFYSPYRCAAVLGNIIKFQSNLAEARQPEPDEKAIAFGDLSKIFPKGQSVLAEYEAKQFLAANGFATARERVCQTVDEAVRTANEFGYPVVLKILSPQILHKTESGGVKLNLRTEDEVAAAFEEILKNVKAYNPQAEIKGILVQEMVTAGEEAILGSTFDAQLGQLIMFGLGGIYVEIAKDVAFRLPPISKEEALKMISETKIAYSVLKGARGKVPADIDRLGEAISRFSHLVGAIEATGTNVEIDLNPIVVLPEGEGIKIVDALIIKK